ncbi:ferritin [Candidatus Woesearchaeota archaeon]|nr:ferritin [Candidatus Woesearchaeota archaeon]
MVLSENMLKALNKQINAEMWSSYIYMSMAAYFDSTGLKGFANWMKVQAKEELMHAEKFYNHVNEMGGIVNFSAIEAPSNDWSSPLEVFEETYKHEQLVTKMIHNLVDISIEEKDHSTNSMLRWFVDEQVEEESSADEIVQKLKLIKENPSGLFMMDQELATRTFVPPVKEK